METTNRSVGYKRRSIIIGTRAGVHMDSAYCRNVNKIRNTAEKNKNNY